MILLLLFVGLILLVAIDVPIAIALGAVTVIAVLMTRVNQSGRSAALPRWRSNSSSRTPRSSRVSFTSKTMIRDIAVPDAG